ncbi:noncompact myelin-associated protein isoform X2 [Choloepus didactylus]|uniref:noncompact myelin-associated protein isoform X2 n=1 Tax=Choloepus didactylus TaxID=27675 RepID=UPI0018A0E43C|nr:noncompact myelin-associated protein isoform X2 [Choloepus didactylus]XP_037684090.1 noncompact myelin-associated protein isoform X2 [Choloepus didactylus]
MTTATPLGDTPFSLNVTTGGEDFLYQSSGAIVAAIVVVVIIIFSVVLILLKMYNRYGCPGQWNGLVPQRSQSEWELAFVGWTPVVGPAVAVSPPSNALTFCGSFLDVCSAGGTVE